MNKQTALISFGTCLVITLLAGGSYWYINRNDSAAISPSSSLSATADTVPLESLGTQQKSSANSNSSLKVQGDSTVNQPTALPEPEQFEIYEQYANEQSIAYVDTVVGNGQLAENGDTVAVVYKGWLTNGDSFDESRKNELGQIEPIVFSLGARQVIPGWEQGIAGMKEGGKRRLIIPSALAYGPTGQGPIPPNALLVFDVELAQVQKGTPGL